MSKSAGLSSNAAGVKQLILGTNKHYPNGADTLHVGGATFTVTSLTQFMQDVVNNREAVEASKAATKAKIETERTQAPSQTAVISAFEAVVRGTFGNSADVLADFGLTPPKARVPLTAEKKAVAAAKRAATRAARHTLGKNQKKGVKGAVSATLVVTPLAAPQPVVTVPSQAPTPAPSPAASPAQAPAPVGGTIQHLP